MKTTKRSGSIHWWMRSAHAALLGCVLSGMAVAQTRTIPLENVLERTGSLATEFLEEFSSVKCSELVTQAKLGKNGKMQHHEEASFDYLLLAQSSGGELSLVESRLPAAAPRHNRNLPLLVTNGFSTLLLVFHPSYQAGFEFNELPDEPVDGKRMARIHFRHIPGMRSTAALVLRGREYPLDLEGTAWIDPETGRIARIHAELGASMEDVGLRALRCEVEYAPVPFHDMHLNSWLPTSAVIEVETPRQHWRNTHRFTSYQRFSTSVESRITVSP